MQQREVSLCQQTGALLHKHLLLKWRNKKQSIQEWLLALAVLLTVCLLTAVTAFYHLAIPDIPEKELGRLDDFNTTGQVIGYTPQTQHTKAIMDKIALQLHGTGIGIEGFEDEKTLEEMWRSSEMLWGIVFKDPFSYDIRTSSERAPMPIDHFGIFYLCLNHTEDCSTTQYWLFGFVFLQANIDAAIIEVQYHRILYWSLWTPFSTFCQLAVRGRSTKYLMVQQVALEQPYFFAEVLGCTVTTNHSVWTQLKSAVGVLLKFPESEFIDPLTTGVCIVMFSMAFFPFLYFLTLNVAREKATLKDLLCMMGLRDLSFWLSWGLLYGVYMCIMAILLAVVAKYGLLVDCSMLMLFLLFFLYGLSGISFCFLLISLLRKPKLTSIIGFLLTLTFGCLSLILLVDDLPPSVMWVLGIILSPCAFSTGMYQVVILENEKEGAHLESLTEGPYPLIGVFCILVLNAILYMLLALYFDKVLPNTYGRRHSPFFLFKSSYWFRQQRGIEAVVDNEDPSDSFTSDYIEPVPLEFRGKEAIRISNIKKTFKEEDTEVKALRGLLFEVYEGQITALLGHSGAGKTTLLNILSGLSPPTDGTVSIYQHTLSEMEDTLKYGQKMVGFCPQFNVKFDILTVKENLRLFAKVRGIPSKEVEREVQNVLNGLDIASIKDTRAVSLSGGQQRKLTLGIAILGNPQILLLDEPTAGLDPCSRHHVWNLLKERKADRVTLFSTQFMDEADILADWKAVLSAGRLKCVGSSMFLKRKWGIGYHLRMHVTETCNAEEITSVVKYHIPSAALSRQHEQEMIYTLPFDNIDSFPELFSDLDTRSGQEITNYGVSMTTLEDVFLKLEGEQAIEQADYRVFSEEHVEEERGGGAVDEMEQTLLSLSETGKATVSGAALWRQQVLAIARVRFLKLKHETKTLRSVIVLFLIFILPMAVQLSLYGLRDQFSELDLKPDLYLLHPGEAPYKRFTNLLIENDTGSEMEDFIRSVKSQNLLLDVNGSHNAEEELTHNLALRVSREGKDYRFTLMTNVRAVNGFPVLMNIISNAFLRSFNSTACIQIANRLFLEDHSKYYMIELYVFSISFMGILAAGLSPYLGISSVQDHKIRAISQLRLSGIFPSAYWCGQALVDMSVLWLLLMAMTAIMCMFNYTVQMSAWGWTALLLTITGYSASSILLVYLISFACHKGRNNPDFWACIFLLVTLGSLTVDGISFFLPVPRYVILFFLCLFVPVYPLGSMMRLESTARTLFYPRGIIEAPTLGIPILAPYIHCIVFTLILRCLEKRYGKKTFRGDPFFRIPPKNDKVSSNLDELEGDDASVQDERTRVQEVIAGQRTEEDSAIVASSLRKEYTDKKASSVFRKKKKAATRNVSFCVKKGEILGLLGPNGAGKSTTIRMLTGDTKPTAGQVLIAGVVSDATAQRQSESIGFLGYCPQENPLWPTLTVKEHLEVYAAVKGMRKEDASVAIKRVTDALELNEQLTRPARKLSEGVKRKVCFALSMLANPTVVLLDEPSTGMDPKGQQRVWRAIRAAFKNKERGAILTTHYMEEAEAVCDRVAIMASGKLRCIGSIQQLKSKFGKGYFLEIKVRDPQQVDVLHKDILKIFPLAARLERFSSLLSYKIPMENVKSLSQAFSVLEEVKRTFNLEEYSFSQSTLEQVFIELTKEQEKDNFDLALDSTFEWKQLQEEDA